VANKDSFGKTLLVALLLCVVCSIIVSSAAVSLRPMQESNKDLDRKRNILLAAGLYDEALSVEEQFKAITTRVVDLDSGKFVDVDPAMFDQQKAAKDPAISKALGEADIAKISRRANQAFVYVVESDGQLDKVILPIHGYGLWSTLYGFMALESDLNTVVGLGFYQHGETPGLGGEVDNPRWKALWPGKSVYDASGDVKIEVVKGAVDFSKPGAKEYHIDGLAGATLTSRGVSNLVVFWLGENGFKPFLENFAKGEA